MGEVRTMITVRNDADIAKFRDGAIPERDIHAATIEVKADSGALTHLVINEATRARLGLRIVGAKTAYGVSGYPVHCQVTETVEIQVRVHQKIRDTVCRAWVVDNQPKMLLGVIALEDMDLRINPVTGELEGVHGDEPLGILD